MIQQKIIDLLSEKIILTQCKHNKKVYISKDCPFCGYHSKKSNVFRYSTKLKVGKSFCCGKSFKEYYWLKRQLEDKDFVEKFNLENKQGLYKLMTDEEFEEYKIFMVQYNKDKMSWYENGFIKSDVDLPF
jgi:hypothetical protein